jgi:F-type H+-transporting ATPase subunit b
MESGLISPNLVTFSITIANIVILYFVLRAILFKPLTKFMAERTKKIRDNIDQVEKDKNQAKRLLEQYEGQLKNAEAEADKIIKAARDTVAFEAEKIIAEGKNASEIMLANARRQMEAEQKAAMAKFRAEAAMLVMAASSQLVRRNLQSDDNLRYANMALDELPSQQKGNG